MIKNLILTGMMGVGKSTIAKSLAKKLSYNYIDVDKIIEEIEGCSIKTIFKRKSEKYFRELEKKTTLELLKKSQSVIALGGGAFLDRSIRNAVKNSSVSLSFILILYDLTGGVQSSLPISIPPTNPTIQKHNNITIIEPIIYSPSCVRYNYIKTILTKTI